MKKFAFYVFICVLFHISPVFAQPPSPTQCVTTVAAGGTGDQIQFPAIPCWPTTTLVIMKVGAANATTTPTISVNGGPFQTITNFDGTPLSVGLFQPGQYRLLSYNGTNWLALSAGAIFNTQGLAVTPTNATLKATVGAANGETIYRAGFNAAGDGGDATYTFSSTNCTISGGDNGLQVQPTAGTGCWIASFQGPANAMVWGASNDGTNGAATTAAINAALADYPAVYLPQGTFHVTDELKCPSGHSLVGAGQGTTTITVGSASGNDFNMSANGVVELGTSGANTACSVDNFSISYYQVDMPGMTISNIIQYPEALDGDNIHYNNNANLAANGITITNAWTCLSMKSGAMTTGGVRGARIACSSYNRGFVINGNTAFIDLTSWDQETFGLTSNQVAVYEAAGEAGTALCGEHQSSSGGGAMHIGFAGCFSQGFTEDLTTDIGADNIDTLDLDGNGAALINNGYEVHVHGGYSTKSSADTLGSIQANAGITQIANFKFATSQPSDILVNGGTLRITHSFDTNNNSTGAPVLLSSGQLSLDDVQYSISGNRTVPTVSATGGTLRMVGNIFPGAGASTGSVLSVTGTDNSQTFVANNSFDGWGVTLPATILGFYDLPDVKFSLTVTPAFATNGDFSPIGNSSAGSFYFVRGDYLDLNVSDSFSTNAYTTASGVFLLGMNVPFATPVGSAPGCTIGTISNVTSTVPFFASISGTNMIFPNFLSNATAQDLGTTAVPASKAGLNFVVSCRYRVR